MECATRTAIKPILYDHSGVKLQNAKHDRLSDIEEAQRGWWHSGLAPAFGPGRDPGDPGSNPTSGSRCMEPASPSAYGPLPNTSCHFWFMFWQQKTKAVVTLNSCGEGIGARHTCEFLVRRCEVYYMVHLLQLGNINNSGVSLLPASSLTFLFKVRESVIHYHAGTGCSSRFSQADMCFAYVTIIEGAKFIKGDSNIQKWWKELSKEDVCPVFHHSPTKIMAEKYNGNRTGLEEEKLTVGSYTGLSSKMQDTVAENSQWEKANTAQKVQQMKQRLNETE
ncbi:unnamed protein product [Nyctereutes procyonoides]|uniref:protein-tyrosine-phosphatase n=1 Tax=Nyctereutes procyonoides TaxID=34880 RepID=A0A811ZTE2_NYCPR|nr:unnamed protein product [Nyctereutes procyonoides]